MSMWVGEDAGTVDGLRRRERKSLQGREDREKGFMVVRRVVIVPIGRDMVVFFGGGGGGRRLWDC